MTANEYERIYEIIRDVFGFESQVHPMTIAMLFKKMSELSQLSERELQHVDTSSCCSVHAGSYEECHQPTVQDVIDEYRKNR